MSAGDGIGRVDSGYTVEDFVRQAKKFGAFKEISGKYNDQTPIL